MQTANIANIANCSVTVRFDRERLAVDKSLRRILGWQALASALGSHVLSRLRGVRAWRCPTKCN